MQITIDTKVKYLYIEIYFMMIDQTIDCLLCNSNRTKKYGILKSWGQRYKCHDCQRTFAVGGTRGTYEKSFKERVVQNYCHRKQPVAKMLYHYGISSRTLIKRSRDHKQTCPECNHGI